MILITKTLLNLDASSSNSKSVTLGSPKPYDGKGTPFLGLVTPKGTLHQEKGKRVPLR